jgi:hypothetical protein
LFVPGDEEGIGVHLAEIALNPEHGLANDLEIDETLDVAYDRAPGAMAFLGEIGIADTCYPID